MVKLQQATDGQFFVTIPKDLAIAKGWVKGMRLFLAFNERGNVEIAEAPRTK